MRPRPFDSFPGQPCRAAAVDTAAIDQMAADLHATADQLRAAIAAADQSLPQA